MDERCLIPDCTSTTIHLRGLCRSCYLYAASLVRHGITTWLQLEATGCVGRADGGVQSPKRPMRTEWFAKGIGVPPDFLQSELRRLAGAYMAERRKPAKRKKRESPNGSASNN